MRNTQSTQFLTEDIQKLKIAVLGDVMLDQYIYGEVKRISPEAPVPVNRVRKMEAVLGGAGNVAANLAGLGVQVYMAGVTGADSHRKELEKKLAQAGIDYGGLLPMPERKTITKLRIIGARQQMLRLDFEEPGDLVPEEERLLLEWLTQKLQEGLNGVILSDYAKGVCSDHFCRQVIDTAHVFQVPVLVDPKGSDWHKYTGCDFITPNVKEMCEAAGEVVPNETEPLVRLAAKARDQFQISNVVVTRSEKGVSLINKNEVITEAATARDVFDVSGAGDTVAAVLLAAAAGKLPLAEALNLSNKAAGIVVSKVGTYPVHREELLKEVLACEEREGQDYRPLSWDEIESLARTWKTAGETVVFTNGCFDILHAGHVQYLEQAAQLGRHLIVGVNTDDSVKRLKGETRPLNKENDRARLLAALACVDAVVFFSEDTPTNLIARIRPDILVKGGDYTPEQVAGREYAGQVRILPFKEGYSTTGVIAKIAALVKEGKI
ncbi:D-glycero-beta-D-manno-heptose-7-phosphate kinase [Acidaminococcus sp. NSJ-142]|jgi:D-beta-D-heptose 7-phosphate kinase/D-beta-D-heptose 1-phosphate adenosyltransferase|uniref:D-glycero-beta-D-manno-heptose-7-phosphate kinase n=1 Tax=Acidaminococcus TaxID=904 RepID=UPI000CF92285|nr:MULTISPECIES: D-glycero-beta-D-manno-heptose-7-phosphate kinase [Acidaminococcus]MCD2435820.1 D-glycero-beta-D-manno-heptose-7-phosphate kinase [Acidaminococcus hominis]MCH4097331.1 D-glycero-beta-D-manno-heptose-7-phosphate kinase [Acidaminococcus provencensis]RHK01258.1 D-glycero-beta-D-manno-heptose-7-phosphate kinase [Acidaminococcus sp. AM05-11]